MPDSAGSKRPERVDPNALIVSCLVGLVGAAAVSGFEHFTQTIVPGYRFTISAVIVPLIAVPALAAAMTYRTMFTPENGSTIGDEGEASWLPTFLIAFTILASKFIIDGCMANEFSGSLPGLLWTHWQTYLASGQGVESNAASHFGGREVDTHSAAPGIYWLAQAIGFLCVVLAAARSREVTFRWPL
jgi:hypothetical protein